MIFVNRNNSRVVSLANILEIRKESFSVTKECAEHQCHTIKFIYHGGENVTLEYINNIENRAMDWDDLLKILTEV